MENIESISFYEDQKGVWCLTIVYDDELTVSLTHKDRTTVLEELNKTLEANLE
jgi:hypothetical protein